MQVLGTNDLYAVAVSKGDLGFYSINPLGQVSSLLLNLGKDSPSLRKEASITLYRKENLLSGCLLVSLEKDNLLVETCSHQLHLSFLNDSRGYSHLPR